MVEEVVKRLFDHGAETLGLSLEIEVIDLRIEDWADDPAPLVGTQDAIAGVCDLGQVGAEEAACGEAVDGLQTEPDCGDKQERGGCQTEMEPEGMIAWWGIRW